MKEQKLTRTGMGPLKFTGELIGEGSTKTVSGPGSNRWTEVDIYRTKGGKYVAQVSNYSQWEGEHNFYKVHTADKPEDLLAALQNDEGMLGRASQEAVERAVRQDEQLAAAYTETID